MRRAVMRVLGSIVLWGACLAAVAAAEAQRVKEWMLQGKHLSYDPATDTFRKQSSVYAPPRRERPGGELVYYGDRRQQFQFRGPRGRGGIYDALREYKESLPLDPNNYRYRLQH
jgi:hypothetical protein